MFTEIEEKIYAGPWKEFCREIGIVPRLHGPIPNVVSGWDSLVSVLVSKLSFPAPDTSVTARDLDLASNYKLRVYCPPNATGNEALGMYIHGGGWVLGSIDQEDAIARIISKACNLVVVSVGYRLAPAHRWPAAHDDCADAAKYALSHAAELGADPNSGILIAGSSAGGGMAFGTALRLIDDGLGDKVSGVVGMVPVTVHPDAVPQELKARYTSYDEHAEHTVNTKDAMDTFFDTYAAPASDPYVSPLLHPKLKALPRTYLTESGTDTLRDDSRLMKEKLEAEGVQVRYDAYEGFPHYSWTFPSEHLAAHSQEFFGNMIQGIKWCTESGLPKI